MWCDAFSLSGTSRSQTRRGRLTVLGHAKDSLWSLDLFRCNSAILRAHWVLVVMDQFTRRIVGFGVHRGVVDGVGLCRMFNRATPQCSAELDHFCSGRMTQLASTVCDRDLIDDRNRGTCHGDSVA
jgi:hypothetical protein